MEEYNLRVFIMVTHSVCGALPLGIVFTSDEKEQTLVDALQLFQSSLPEFAFYGASPSTGPKVIMTDNCSELREALKTVWPNATTVLCIFHVLQQVYNFKYFLITQSNSLLYRYDSIHVLNCCTGMFLIAWRKTC